MSETTTSPRFEEWSNRNSERRKSPVPSQRLEKRKRMESDDHVTREFGLMRNGGDKGIPRFIGSGSGIYFIRTVYGILSRNSRPVDKSNVRGDLVPGEEDELVDPEPEPGSGSGPGPEHVETPGIRSRIPFWRQDEIIEETAQGVPTVDFDNLVQWTRSYFENWHSAFPFLHGPEVLETFERITSVSIAHVSEADATIVRAMVSISLADARQLVSTASESKSLLFMTLFAKHARLRGLILELRNKSIAARHDTVDRAMHVQSELAKWANEVHERSESRLEFEDESSISSDSAHLSSFHGAFLMIMYHESIINLNRPLLASDIKSPASRAALQACISASRALIDAIISNDPRQNRTSGQNVLLYPFMTWSVWMSCFILTYAALEGETTLSSAQKYARKALYILKQLSLRGTAWPESCARGVEHLASALQRKQDEGIHRGSHENPVSSPATSNEQPARDGVSHPEGLVRVPITDSRGKVSSDTAGETPKLTATPTSSQGGRRASQVITSSLPESRSQARGGVSQYQRPAQISEVYDFQSRISLGAPQFTPGQTPMPLSEMLPGDIYSQEWFDPLGPLDFSNFAQVGTTDSAFEFGFS
ncbi:hypothetical protein LQW54_001237 [Pestalotiopsis sp. IQ-011]